MDKSLTALAVGTPAILRGRRGETAGWVTGGCDVLLTRIGELCVQFRTAVSSIEAAYDYVGGFYDGGVTGIPTFV